MERLVAMGVLGACTWKFPAPGRCRGALGVVGQRDEEQGVHGQSAERRGLGEARACHGEGVAMEGNLEMSPWFLLAAELGHGEAGAPCARTRGPSGALSAML
jgi:hypothetical protein